MRNKLIEEFFNNLDLDVDIDCVNFDDINDFDDLYNALGDINGFDQEFIYYKGAMDYLMENDMNLTESLRLADDYGFETKHLNSCMLAGILNSSLIRDEFYEEKDNIENFFENLPKMLRNKKIENILK